MQGVNIARGMPTKHEIGTLSSYGPGRAVDGNTDGNFNAGSCSHTLARNAFNSRAYWTVFLAGMYTIKGVRIYTCDGYFRKLLN